MNYSNKGQATLILVLGVMMIGLGIGISRFTRTTSSLRETTYDSQREQSYNCAESGVELAVKCINDELSSGGNVMTECQSPNPTPISNDPGACTYQYSVTEIKEIVQFPLLQNNQTEAIIISPNTTNINIKWNEGEGNYLEENLLTPAGVGSGYNLRQSLYKCGSPTYQVSEPSGSTMNLLTPTPGNPCEYDDDDTKLGSSEFMQLTARTQDLSNIIIELSGTDLATQGYKIISTGLTGEAKREVEVNYMLPNVAREFNSTFYSDSVEN